MLLSAQQFIITLQVSDLDFNVWLCSVGNKATCHGGYSLKDRRDSLVTHWGYGRYTSIETVSRIGETGHTLGYTSIESVSRIEATGHTVGLPMAGTPA